MALATSGEDNRVEFDSERAGRDLRLTQVERTGFGHDARDDIEVAGRSLTIQSIGLQSELES